MTERNINQRVSSGATWENEVGYCRALRKGNHVWVSGTVAVDDKGKPLASKDPFRQAKRCIEIIANSLGSLGTDLSSVTRTRMFVTDASLWREFGRAHAEAFGKFPPTTTMVEVKGLISNDFLIEIEADAFVEN